MNELNTKLNEEVQTKEQLEESLKTKDSEIEVSFCVSKLFTLEN